MKYLFLLLTLVAISCKHTEPKPHCGVWQMLFSDHNGAVWIDTTLCSPKFERGDTIFVIRESDGGMVFQFIKKKPEEINSRDQGFFPLDTNKYITRSTNYAYLVRNWHGENILAVAADTSYIEFYGKRFYPSNGYEYKDMKWDMDVTIGDHLVDTVTDNITAIRELRKKYGKKLHLPTDTIAFFFSDETKDFFLYTDSNGKTIFPTLDTFRPIKFHVDTINMGIQHTPAKNTPIQH